MSSRLVNPTTPGGLLSPGPATLTPSEELVIQAQVDGTYFVENEVPTGSINDSNTSFSLASSPNPAGSLQLYLNGAHLKVTEDYTLSGSTITMVSAPPTGSLLLATYRVSPV